jgi:hypothetical protein
MIMIPKRFSTGLYTAAKGNPLKTSETLKTTIPTVIKVLTANELLNTPIRQRQLKEIETRVAIPEKYFNALYTTFINNLAEFYQSLPDTIRPYLKNGGLLTHALDRGVYLLRLREKHLLPTPETPKQQMDSEKPLWTYVVFTATLLRDVGIVATNYPVQLVKEDGEFAKMWDGYLSSMLDQNGEYYRFRETVPKPLEFSIQTTPMIARQLLPKEGFSWIASDERALKAWVAILSGTDTGSGGMALLLKKVEEELAKAHATGEHYITESLLERDLNSLPPTTIKETPETEVGELFAKWLKDGLENGSITVNDKDSRVHTTEEGLVLIYPEIFQDFCSAFPRFKDWIVVYKQFNHLGLHALSGDDKLFYRFFGQKDPTAATKQSVTVKGLLLKDYRSFVPSNFDGSKVSSHVQSTKPQNPFAGVVLIQPSLPPIVPGGPSRGPGGRIG